MFIKHIFLLVLFSLTLYQAMGQQTVRYDLYVHDTVVNYTGNDRKAIAVNGQFPMPTLTFTQGDTAEIHIHNRLKDKTGLHWHGLFLPNADDGVPYLTQMPINEGAEYVYRFPIIQNGTHWYHSHFGLQEQIGMYGSFILNKKQGDPTFRAGIDDLPSVPVILSEWTDYKPENIHRMLHNGTDWFAIKKGTVQSYSEAILQGQWKTKFVNEWKRMEAMDVSDIYYNKFLTNGQNQVEAPSFKAGDKIRLQVSNGGASTYFWLTYAGGKITVVAKDGNDVEPVEVDRLIIAVAETYDLVVTIPDNGSYEFLSTSEDRTGFTSLWLGIGTKHAATPLPRLKYFEGMQMMNSMMKMNGNMNDMGMNMSLNQMDMNRVMYPEITGMPMKKKRKGKQHDHEHHTNEPAPIVTLNYAMLRSPVKTTLPDSSYKVLKFELNGNMSRYVWSMDNKTLSEADKILIRKGENVRIILYNNSMMRHPMHLHGHDFVLVNGHGDYAPLMNTVDLMPMETDTLDFTATESGDWFFHCHILYHMMSGMGRLISYEQSPVNPLITNPKMAKRMFLMDDKKFHPMLMVDVATNGSDGEFMLANKRWLFQVEWRLGYNNSHGYEAEAHFGRYIGKYQWLFPYIGFDVRYREHRGEIEKNIFQQKNTKDGRYVFCVGVQYTLPLLVVADIRLDSDLRVRLQLSREDIPLTPRLRLGVMANSDLEYMVGLRYIVSRYFSLRWHYDSDMGFGAGVTFTY